MGLFLTIVILSIIISIIVFIDSYTPIYDMTIFTLVGTIAAGAITGIITISACALDAPTERTVVSSTDLRALKDNSSITGHTFLGSGGVDNTLQYYYLIEEKGKGIVMQKQDANYSYLNYIPTGETPRVEHVHEDFTNPILRFFTFKKNCYYSFYIPEGSIDELYQVDLEG